jgi:hypothetical protein
MNLDPLDHGDDGGTICFSIQMSAKKMLQTNIVIINVVQLFNFVYNLENLFITLNF